MAKVRDQAWVSAVLTAESVEQGLVFGKSLLKCGTTRTLVVLVSEEVEKSFKNALNAVFDLVLRVDENLAKQVNLSQETRAKLFALSLPLFRKCIFVTANFLAVQNPDRLFTLTPKKLQRTELSSAMFVINAGENEKLKRILKNGRGSDKNLDLSLAKVWKLPTETRITYSISNFSFGGIFVEFSDGIVNEAVIKTSINKNYVQLAEKTICQLWLNEKNGSQTCPMPLVHISSPDLLPHEPIAIVGLSCRLPGANSPQEFWNLLSTGTDATSGVPPLRWTPDQGVHYLTEKEMHTRGGFLSTPIDQFDARFFGLNNMEAKYLDPQARVMFEVAWEALENAGVDPLSLRGSRTGIFSGSWTNDYRSIVVESTEGYDFFRSYMGNAMGATNAKLSHLLGLSGPSIATENACSSGMVSVHNAVRSLQNGDADLALAAGVNLMLRAYSHETMSFVLSPTGRCKTFDKNGDGFARAEGCGVLVLKRLSDAVRDQDGIWAVIRGTGTAQDGETKSMGTPTAEGEAAAIERALEDGHVDPSQVSFVECHGTGTSVGDPVEVEAVRRGYGNCERERPLVIASVKTNVGNTESCSGVTGIIKTVLSMANELIPKHLNLQELNPAIDLASIPAQIPTEPIAWPKNVDETPRMAGVSSFGLSGTEAHVILEEPRNIRYPKVDLGLERPLHLFKISGKTEEALESLHESYISLFREREMADDFANAAYTANVGRSDFNFREFFVASDFADADTKIKSGKYQRATVPELKKESKRILCFLSTGQGSQFSTMAKQLHETCPVFRINFDRCCHLLQTEYGINLKPKICNGRASKTLDRTLYSQISVFCVGYCILKIWESWGIRPDIVLGHGLGEFCAAVAADILSFEDALKLLATRSKLVDALPTGSMMLLKCNKQKCEQILKENRFQLDIAAVNAPEETVVAGHTEEVEFLEEFCKQELKISTILLKSSHAFHSFCLDPILEEYRNIAQGITPKKPKGDVKFISSVTGKVISAQELTADYWVRQARDKVNFVGACAELDRLGVTDYLEIGPQPILSSFLLRNSQQPNLTVLPSLRKGQEDWNVMLTSLGKLYLLGYDVDWKGYDAPYAYRKVHYLPSHPFFRKRYWMESNAPSQDVNRHPLAGEILDTAISESTVIFQNDLRLSGLSYLKDHCIGTHIIFPGAGYMEMCLTVGKSWATQHQKVNGALVLENASFEAPLELRKEQSCRMEVILKPEQDDQNVIKVYRQQSHEGKKKWVLHTSTHFHVLEECPSSSEEQSSSLATSIVDIEPVSAQNFYKKVHKGELKFGPLFQNIQRVWKLEGNHAITQVKAPKLPGNYLLNPLLLDAALQSCIFREIDEDPKGDNYIIVPVNVDKFTVYPTKNETVEGLYYVHTWRENDLYFMNLYTEDYKLICKMERCSRAKTTVHNLEAVLTEQTKRMPDLWQEKWNVVSEPFSNSVELNVLGQIETEGQGENLSKKDFQVFTQIDRLIYLHVCRYLKGHGWNEKSELDAQSFCETHGILPKYGKLLNFFFNIVRNFGKSSLTNEQMLLEIENVTNFLADSNANHEVIIYNHIAAHLPEILKGECDPLAILFPQEEEGYKYSANCYYKNHPGLHFLLEETSQAVEHILQQIRDRQVEENRVIRILEIGSGTGQMTRRMMTILEKVWGVQFEYYFTDVSHSFFTWAGEFLGEHQKNVTFSLFNIDQHPLEQGVPLHHFDLAIAMECLHVAKDMTQSLNYIHQTLKPHGALVICESIIQSWETTFVFGMLDGYWAFQDTGHRPDHCCMKPDTWGRCLEGSGFSRPQVKTAYNKRFGCIVSQAKPLDNPVPTLQKEKRDWILFMPDECSAIIPMLESVALYYNVTCITRSSANVDLPQGVRSIVLAEVTEDSSALDFILKNVPHLSCVTYAWGMDTLARSQVKPVILGLLHTARHILSTPSSPPSLCIVTRGVYSPDGGKATNPSAAVLLGMAKCLKNEHSALNVHCVDLAPEMGGEVATALLYEAALSNQTASVTKYFRTAYRNGQRYAPVFCKADELLPQKNGELFDGKSSLLITGGLNGLGFEICQWMVEKGASDVFLVGRRPAEINKASIIEALRQQGHNITVILADVGDVTQCKMIFDKISEDGKPLKGIFHCAGCLHDESFENLTWAHFQETLNPKFEGCWNLHEFSKDLPDVEHFVLFSSVTALIGNVGQGNHVAACSFEDALAHHRRSLGLSAVSINWGHWAQVGIAKNMTIGSGILPVTANRMMCAYEQILRTKPVQISPCDFESFAKVVNVCPISKHYVDPTLLQERISPRNGQDND